MSINGSFSYSGGLPTLSIAPPSKKPWPKSTLVLSDFERHRRSGCLGPHQEHDDRRQVFLSESVV